MKKFISRLIIAVFLFAFSENTFGISIGFSVKSSSCGAPDGRVAANASDGVGPYTYLWNTGAVTSKLEHVLPGTYTVTVTDLSGNTATGSVTVNANNDLLLNEETFAATGSDNNGYIEINIEGGQSPFQIQSACSGWTPSITQSLTPDFTITGLSGYSPSFIPGMGCNPSQHGIEYDVEVTDAGGCSSHIHKTIRAIGCYTSPVALPSCASTATGKIQDTIKFSQPPFQYLPAGVKVILKKLSNSSVVDSVIIQQQGMGHGFDAAYEIDSLLPGNYKVEYYLKNIYSQGPPSYLSVPFKTDTVAVASLGTNCGNVSGTVFFDTNGNCVKDPGEPALPNSVIEIQPGNHFTIADSSGQYEFSLGLGSYTVSHIPEYGAELISVCPSSGTQTIFVNSAQQLITLNFADSSSGKNLAADIQLTSLQPGNRGYMIVSAVNISATKTISDTLTVTFDTSLNVISSSQPYISYVPGELKFVVDSLHTFEKYITSVLVEVNPAAIAGAVMSAEVQLSSGADIDADNNHDFTERTLTSAKVPFRKTVFPSGFANLNYLPNSMKNLEFMIEFQNTGNDTAFTVSIVDSISQWLDVSSFEMIYSTHPLTTNISTDAITFLLDGIDLPDSSTDEIHSKGFLIYRIPQLQDNQAGVQIRGDAEIWMNGSGPVANDTCLLTIYDCDSLFTSPGVNILACENSTISFGSTPSVPAQMEWYMNGSLISTTSSITIPNISAGQHDITAFVNTPYCSASQMYVVNAATLPDAIFTIDGDTLTADPTGVSYQWYLEGVAIPGATDPVYIATTSGSYSLQVISFIGCVNMSLPTIVTITGIGTVAARGIAVFPNPGSNQLNFILPSAFNNTDISIFSMDGKLLLKEVAQSGELTTLNTSALLPGMYTVFIEQRGERYSTKWIKQ